MSVYEQLTEQCDCLEVNDCDVDELIGLISAYTCWTQKPCETFLMSERTEVVELPRCLDECSVYVFEPFYRPFDPQSFTFTLIEQKGIEEIETPITDYKYSLIDENFRLALPLPNCKCRPKCGCDSTYKLIVSYNAGYEELPDCLIPVFCSALEWVRDKNNCCCEECAPCDASQRTTEGRIDYTTLDGRLQDYFLNILSAQYIRQLSLISLCDSETNMWAVTSCE